MASTASSSPAGSRTAAPGVTLLAYPWATTPAAAAEAVAAARQTEADNSGQVVGDIRVVSSPDGDSDVPGGGGSGITAGFTLLYSDGDFDLTTMDGNGATRLIGVGDSRYTQLPGVSTVVRADSAEDRGPPSLPTRRSWRAIPTRWR